MPKARLINAGDASDVRAMVNSAGWQHVRDRLMKTLDQKRDELEQPCDPVKTSELRGCIAGLKLAIAVPDILFAEGKGRTEE